METLETSQGFHAELIRIPASSALNAVNSPTTEDATVRFVMIGGNPCSPMFYADFVRRVCAMAEGRMDGVVVGHLGHDAESLNGGRLFTLDEQIDHHTEHVMRCLDGDAQTQLVLCGHSVGAYMCLHVLDRLSASQRERVRHALLLFPTLMEIAETPRGRETGTSTVSRVFTSSLAGLVSCLPTSLRHHVIRSNEGPDLPHEAVESADRFISRGAVSNALYLFKHEARQIKSLNTATLAAHAEKLTLYFGSDDGWAPLAHRDAIKELVPGCRVLTDENETPHAFSLRDSQYVAEQCWCELDTVAKVFDTKAPAMPTAPPEGGMRLCG